MKVGWELNYFLRNEVEFLKNEVKNKIHSPEPKRSPFSFFALFFH